MAVYLGRLANETPVVSWSPLGRVLEQTTDDGSLDIGPLRLRTLGYLTVRLPKEMNVHPDSWTDVTLSFIGIHRWRAHVAKPRRLRALGSAIPEIKNLEGQVGGHALSLVTTMPRDSETLVVTVEDESRSHVGIFELGQNLGQIYASDAVEVVVPIDDDDALQIPGLWRLSAGDGDRSIRTRRISVEGRRRVA